MAVMVVVVVSHIRLGSVVGIDGIPCFYTDVGGACGPVLRLLLPAGGKVRLRMVLGRSSVALVGIVCREWASVVAVLTFGDVDLSLTVVSWGSLRSLMGGVLAVKLGLAFGGELSTGVSTKRLLIVARIVYLCGEALVTARISSGLFDVHFLVGRTVLAVVVFFVDVNFLGLVAALRSAGRELCFGGVAGFVIFPSVARSLLCLGEVDFALYLDLCGLLGFDVSAVAPV